MGQEATGKSRAARQHERTLAPPPVPADVGIVAALPIEVGYLIDCLRKVRKYHSATIPVFEGEYGGKIVALAVGGVGRKAAQRAGEVLIAGHRPRWIISAGFAGGLNPAFARNDLVLAHEVIDTEGRCFPVELPQSLAAGLRHHRGRLLTVDQIVRTTQEKAELRSSFAVDMVDMESSAVAALCSEKLVRFLSLRVLFDDSQTDLPREVATLLVRSGSYRVGAAIRALWRRPSSLKDWWTLQERALEAADLLAKFVVRCLEGLPV